MTGLELVVLGVAGLATAALTAVAGAGGGMILLIVMLQFVDPLVAIPAHGVIQLCSNGTRAVTLRHDVDRSLIVPFVVPLVPATVIGYLIADSIPRSGGRALIGVFALVAVWWPAATSWLAPNPGRGSRFGIVGAFAGLVNPTLGAIGPLLAPAFRAATADHVSMVATAAVGQALGHVVKVAAFAVVGYAWSDHIGMVLVGTAGVVLGTRIGAHWLRRLDPVKLDWLFKVAVSVGSGRLLASWVI